MRRAVLFSQDFFRYARESFDIIPLDVPEDVINHMRTANEEGELGQHKSHLVELYRLVLKAGGTGGRRWWECKADTTAGDGRAQPQESTTHVDMPSRL